jgi:phosphoenolpyruvate carboxykinase (GTP)
VETPIGLLPTADALNTDGLDVPLQAVEELVHFDADAWAAELPAMREHLARFGDRLPAQLQAQLDKLADQL